MSDPQPEASYLITSPDGGTVTVEPIPPKPSRRVTIQPESWGLKEPYPWHIDEEGRVGRQDFWKGDPSALAGFVDDPQTTGRVDLELDEFLDAPEEAVGRYPVFVRSDRSMATFGDSRIGSVHEEAL